MSSSSINSKSQTILIQNGSENTSRMHNHSQQSLINNSANQQQLQKLKMSLEMSKEELIQITNKNQFSQKVFCFNNQAKKLIEANKIQEALVYLNQAQKILEYAASSGKNIQRKSIVQVLHNQACCYQILWDLEKCSNYIEALIFNFNSELKFSDFQSNHPSQIQMSASKKSLSAYSKIESVKIQKKIQLSKYYLLYCAINSQLKNNQGALVAAKKASQISKQVMKQLLQIYEDQKQNNTPAIQNIPQFVHPMLQQIPNISTTLNVNRIDDLFCLVRHYIKIYNSKCIFNNLSASKQSNHHTKQVYQKYKNFSIGNIMQLQPVGDTSQSSKNILDYSQHERINYEKLIQKLIVFSICQFTMATELRYIALNNAKNDKQLSQTMLEFKESQTYHLLSILIVAMYMPFDIIYMEHIISSYHGHYKTVLLSNGLDGTPQLNQDDIKRIKQTLIFQHKDYNLTSSSSRKQEDAKKCSTTNQSNNSLIVSFHEQDQDQQSKQGTYKKSKQSSNKKSSHKKQNHHSSLIHDQDDLSQSQKHLFDEYYYVKKNTQPNHENCLAYHQSISSNKKSLNINNLKSKSKNKKISMKSNIKRFPLNKNSKSKTKINTQQSIEQNKQNKKQLTKSKSKSKQSTCFQSKPSTLIINSQHTHGNKMKSQITPHMAYSPVVLPQIYSKIKNTSSKSKKSKSKQSKAKKQTIKNNQNIKHQSQYFNKCNFSKKTQNKMQTNQLSKQNGKENHKKSRSHKKRNDITKNDPIKIQYFHVHDPNILKDHKSGPKKQLQTQQRRSISKSKKQRLSSRSLQKALSPSGISKKSNIQRNSKFHSNIQKQKRTRLTELGGRYQTSTLNNNRQSVSSKKSQRHTIHKLTDRLVTEQSSKTMKASHFDKYYL